MTYCRFNAGEVINMDMSKKRECDLTFNSIGASQAYPVQNTVKCINLNCIL